MTAQLLLSWTRATVLTALLVCFHMTVTAREPEVTWSASVGVNAIRALAYSTDGQMLAAGDAGGRIRWFDGRAGVVGGTIENDNSGVANLWFRSDGTLLSFDATHFIAYRLRLWRLADQTLLRSDTFPVRPALWSYSEAGDLVGGTVYSSTDSTSMVWHAEGGKVFDPNSDGILYFSPDGQELVVGCGAGALYYDIYLYRPSDWSLRSHINSGAWDPPGGIRLVYIWYSSS